MPTGLDAQRAAKNKKFAALTFWAGTRGASTVAARFNWLRIRSPVAVASRVAGRWRHCHQVVGDAG